MDQLGEHEIEMRAPIKRKHKSNVKKYWKIVEEAQTD